MRKPKYIEPVTVTPPPYEKRGRWNPVRTPPDRPVQEGRYWIHTVLAQVWDAFEARILKQSVAFPYDAINGSSADHLVVNLAGSGSHFVHRLQMFSHYTGQDYFAYQVRHGRGGSQDNRLQNLRFGTHKENMEDKKRQKKLNKRPKVRLTEEQVLEIDQKLRAGMYAKDIAPEYGVHRKTITGLKNGVAHGKLTGRVYCPKRSNKLTAALDVTYMAS